MKAFVFGSVTAVLLLAAGVVSGEETPKADASKPPDPPAGAYTSPITKPKKEEVKDDKGNVVKDDKGKPVTKDVTTIDKGDTAWMLISTALVMLMVPGLALFYGGLVRRKNVLGTMMHSMVALGLIGVQWLLFGYCLAFGQSKGGWIGWSSELIGLQGVLSNDTFSATTIPIYVHCMYQGMFAIITPALISGALAERIKFGPYCLFILLWSTLVYDPLAHWVWALNSKGESVGFLGALGAIDFAGGTVVHVAAGVGALAAILALRKRIGYPEHAIHPNSVVLSLTGAGLLWFGWFGFNGGSGLGASAQAGSALTATQVAAAAAALTWSLVEWVHRGKPTGLGLATGLVAGLVAVTPASGFVTPLGALLIGTCAGVVCYVFVIAKPWLKYDDSLDAFGVHGVGGALGAILTGVFASAALYTASTGLPSSDSTYALAKLDGEGGSRAALIMAQLTATGMAAAFSFVVSFVLVKVIDLVFGFCLTPQDENLGLDRAAHGETGFDFGLGSDVVAETALPEPKPASMPPNGQQRFVLLLEGIEPAEATRVWTELNKPGGSVSLPPEYRQLYPYLTTVQGNRFRFRSGNPTELSKALERLFEAKVAGKKPRAQVVTA